MCRISMITPVFETLYSMPAGLEMRPAMLAVARSTPFFCFRMMGSAAFTQRKTPVRLTSRTRRHDSSGQSPTGTRQGVTPALASRMSRRPYCRNASAKAASTCPHCVTSATSDIASPPASLMRAAIFSASLPLMSTTATFAPSAASLCAQAAPIPEPAPVMRAVFPTYLDSMIVSFLRGAFCRR